MNKITFKILGGILILSGISTWLNPDYYSSRFGINFDFSEIKWPLCGFLVILGFYFIWSSCRKKTSEDKKQEIKGE